MTKSRILWVVWMLTAVVFWLFTEDYSGILLLTASLFVPLLLGILTKTAAGKLKIRIQAEAAGEKSQFLKGSVTIENTGLFSLDRIGCTVKCENLMTGEVFHQSLRMGALGRMTTDREFEFKSRHCGRLRLSVPKLTLYDPFGIFRFRIQTEGETRTLVRPETFPLEVQIVYGESMSLDSDEYSMQKAGFDPSETFAIREYMPGDRIKQIHWKLSEKMDNLMVRDYGLPIQNTILLLLETGLLTGEENRSMDPECMDAFAEGIVSLSQELIEQQVVHSLGWYNHEEGSFYCSEITCQEELATVIPELLGTVPKEDTMSVAGHYLEGHEQCEFAHMVLFAPHHVDDMSAVADQCLVTEILCEKDGGGGYNNDDARILSVNPDSITEDLAYLEI